MMNSGLKILAIAAITISCLIAAIMKADPLSIMIIGFIGVWALDELV